MRETPSQTAGPYVHIGCTPHVSGITSVYGKDLGTSPIDEGAKGQVIEISGAVFDGEGAPIGDGLFETWQADASGVYPGQREADPKVLGWARFATRDDGSFNMTTIKPGRCSMPSGHAQAPHISIWLVARGLNIGLQTRLYFGDEDNTNDPILSKVDENRRGTITTTVVSPNTHRFDIHLQGDAETVFLDI